MPPYNYIDDYERDWTQKYEGTYTSAEVELTKNCMKNA